MVRDSVTMVFRFVCHQKWRIFKCFCSLAVADFFLQKWLETAGILTYFKVETISAGKKIKAKPVFSLWRTAQYTVAYRWVLTHYCAERSVFKEKLPYQHAALHGGIFSLQKRRDLL